MILRRLLNICVINHIVINETILVLTLESASYVTVVLWWYLVNIAVIVIVCYCLVFCSLLWWYLLHLLPFWLLTYCYNAAKLLLTSLYRATTTINWVFLKAIIRWSSLAEDRGHSRIQTLLLSIVTTVIPNCNWLLETVLRALIVLACTCCYTDVFIDDLEWAKQTRSGLITRLASHRATINISVLFG